MYSSRGGSSSSCCIITTRNRWIKYHITSVSSMMGIQRTPPLQRRVSLIQTTSLPQRTTTMLLQQIPMM
jgi:hypothetical protein